MAGPGCNDPLVLSYLGLRKAVGIIGTLLPAVLALGKVLVFRNPGLQASMSAYYYTPMRDVFVGSLCAIAVFLMSYRGYEQKDRIAAVMACIFGVGIALFPTRPAIGATTANAIVGGLHFFFAASFFLTLAYFSLALFTKTGAPGAETRRKLQRNQVYRVCGWTILACVGLSALGGFLPDDSPIWKVDPLFFLEAVAVMAFGLSWLTKGEAILKDEPPASQTVSGSRFASV